MSKQFLRDGSAAPLALLAMATALSRFAFRSHYLYDIDSVNFALAMRHFDPLVHQPHPPGYFLYVLMGRLVQAFIPDANGALVAVSIAASVLTVLGIHRLAAAWFGREAGLFAGIAFVLSPLSWFHGTVALTYIVEACFSGWCGYFFWRARQGEGWLVVPGALLLGLAAGFRPSCAAFLGPLLLFALVKTKRSQQAAAALAFAAAMLMWAIPMIRQSGGIASWWSSFLVLWQMQGGKQTAFNSSPVTSFVRAVTVVGILILCFGTAVLPAFVRRSGGVKRDVATFVGVWIAPGILFFVFIFLRWINSGYLLIVTPPVFAWLGYRSAEWFRAEQRRPRLRLALLATACLTNTALFLFAPVYCSYRSLREFEAELSGVIASLPQTGPPSDTLIVGFDSHFLGYRHAGYYLPDYQTVQFPEVSYPAGKRVFSMIGGLTTLLGRIPAERYRRFVFCPLPVDDPEYRRYMESVISRIPEHDLERRQSGGREYVTVPIRDLALLFPSAAP